VGDQGSSRAKEPQCGEHWNIFSIARRGSADDEDQLTELLAYLIHAEPAVGNALLADFGCEARSFAVKTQRRVQDGRLDLELSAPGNAEAVIESKLRAHTTFEQCAKYIEHLSIANAPVRVLVLVTKLHEDWPNGVTELAAERDVRLVARRWWDIKTLLGQTSSELATDFAEMLEREGLVVPDALPEEDWSSSPGIPPAAVALLSELKPGLAKLSVEAKSQAIYDGGHRFRSVYCSARFKQAEIAVGLAATWKDFVEHRRVQPKSTRPRIEGSVIASFVRDLNLTDLELRATAEEAVRAGGNDVVGISWKQCPVRAAPAASILTASDFLGQVEQALEYARLTAEDFRQVGYLKDSL
jgi:hypothetical protein